MEIEDKYLSVENCEEGDIITFVDAGLKAELTDKGGKKKQIVNFTVSNGRYTLTYTPGATATKELMKAFTRETNNWVGKKFTVKIVDTLSFGKPSKIIFPVPIKV